jgi:hypothetical protein
MGKIEDFAVQGLFAADVDFEPQTIYRVKSPPGAFNPKWVILEEIGSE